MQALILAAGMGRRLGELTQDKTKGMVEVNGHTLLQRSLDILTSFEEIERIVIVVGHAAERVRRHIGDSYNGRPVVYVENPDYDETNNIYSLYLARHDFKQHDTILLESDLIFERSLVEELIDNKAEPDLILVARWQSWMDGTVATLTNDNRISQLISKENFDFDHSDTYYKTVNIYKFSKEFISRFYIPFLEAYCKAFGHDEYYENILAILTFLQKTKLKASTVAPHQKWYEIDDLNDLDIAETLFSEGPDSYLSRYGGFWRFPHMIDFAYLVNPYFPPVRMEQEFKTNFTRLLAGYPSTSRIQRRLAAGLFGCSERNLIVGNGASELITTLLSVMEEGRIGMPIPTFHEYVARAGEERAVCFLPENADFSYVVDDLFELSEKVDALVVVNPDNPSGNFIRKPELLRLIEHLQSKGKTIVVDESFVDFCGDAEPQSLIDDELLNRFENLVVVKSIGKSYGVPGCRLGVLASGNPGTLQKVGDQLPVWNISSFGEFFLQVCPRYADDYRRSLDAIVEQRARLFQDLSTIEFLRPIPSAANYILCEVLPPYTCEHLANTAMERGCLIKDCSDKPGFHGKQYIRVTVRDGTDNGLFVDTLKKMLPPAG